MKVNDVLTLGWSHDTVVCLHKNNKLKTLEGSEIEISEPGTHFLTKLGIQQVCVTCKLDEATGKIEKDSSVTLTIL